MLIPAAIGLLISTILFNLSFLAQGTFFMSKPAQLMEIGKVLGASEANSEGNILVEQSNNFNKTIVRVIEEAKALPLPQFFKLSPLDRPASRPPEDSVKRPKPIIADGDFSAQNGVILDCDDDSLSFAKYPDRIWPIASITKLFTAYTFLDYNPGWETSYEIKAADKREGGKIYLFTGDKVKVKDLFYFSLVGSDNTATAALVQATGLSETEFMEKMNAKIKELGLLNTKLVDPVGLKDENVSTAREVAFFARIALAKEEISRASLTKAYEFKTEQGRKKIITNTNVLLDNFPDQGIGILGGKTGYVDSSGYCLVSQFKSFEGQEIITVVLGADSDSGRFSLTKKLVDSYYNNKP